MSNLKPFVISVDPRWVSLEGRFVGDALGYKPRWISFLSRFGHSAVLIRLPTPCACVLFLEPP